jgi:hypothetical protein
LVPAVNATLHAFLIDTAGTMRDLNDLIPPDSGWVLQRADGINDAGQISGYGSAPNGSTRAFLLTPVPEASFVAPLGFMGIAWSLRWRPHRFHW